MTLEQVLEVVSDDFNSLLRNQVRISSPADLRRMRALTNEFKANLRHLATTDGNAEAYFQRAGI